MFSSTKMFAMLLHIRSSVVVQDIPSLSHTSGTDFNRNALLIATPFLHKDLLVQTVDISLPITPNTVFCNVYFTTYTMAVTHRQYTQLPFLSTSSILPIVPVYKGKLLTVACLLLNKWKGATTEKPCC